jgi:hypothetical protein
MTLVIALPYRSSVSILFSSLWHAQEPAEKRIARVVRKPSAQQQAAKTAAEEQDKFEMW